MSKDKIKNIHLVYSCITAALVVIVGIAMIISCVMIHGSGDRPFSREVIALALSKLAIPCLVCLVLIVGSIVLHIVLPVEEEKAKGIVRNSDLLQRYAANFSQLSENDQKQMQKETSLRRTLKLVTAIIIAALAVYPILYFADVSHFGVTDINGDIMSAVLVALIPAAVSLVLVYLCGLLCDASIQRQIDICKNNSLKAAKIPHQESKNVKYMGAVRCVLIVAAAALIILGIANDGVADVLGKAIRICTECIGLG